MARVYETPPESPFAVVRACRDVLRSQGVEPEVVYRVTGQEFHSPYTDDRAYVGTETTEVEVTMTFTIVRSVQVP